MPPVGAVRILDQSWFIGLPVPYVYAMWWPWLQNYRGEYKVGVAEFHNFLRYVWMDTVLKEAMGY